MIRITEADGVREYALLDRLRERSEETDSAAEQTVREILAEVRRRGDDAVLDYGERFDGVRPDALEVSQETIRDALTAADQRFLDALMSAQENIAEFHSRQQRQSFFHSQENGVILGQQVRGLDRVGVYVPGGTAAYPSSVLMNVIPAIIAGVGEIVMVTPPRKDGTPNPDILVAAALVGVDRIFLAGGAQAVAALAYGTVSIPKVDKIVGPGNLYVATAKRMLYGTVDIDMVAGPSEILILADKAADPDFIAADLLGQAEHDVLASAILLTTDAELARKVTLSLERQAETLPRREIVGKSIADYGAAIVCGSTEQMLGLAEQIAPEHLEIMLENPLQYLGRIKNAGSVFLGDYAPEALGDYYAGPNHVLPTGGTARFFSPLSVDSFVKRTAYTYYTREALAEGKEDIVAIAEREGLSAHARSVAIRFEKQEKG